MAKVICKVCGIKFDREKEPAVLVSARRYAHASCAVGYEVPKETRDLEELHQYLQKLFMDRYDYVSLDRQIKSYIDKNGYTASGIMKTLIYWYEVQEKTTEKADGRIGIVPHIYQDAKKYYYDLYKANEKNMGKNLDEYKAPQVTEIHIKKPAREPIKFRLFDLDE